MLFQDMLRGLDFYFKSFLADLVYNSCTWFWTHIFIYYKIDVLFLVQRRMQLIFLSFLAPILPSFLFFSFFEKNVRISCLQENGDVGDDGLHRGVQYPFSVNEKVIIKVSFLFVCVCLFAPFFFLGNNNGRISIRAKKRAGREEGQRSISPGKQQRPVKD